MRSKNVLRIPSLINLLYFIVFYSGRAIVADDFLKNIERILFRLEILRLSSESRLNFTE